MELLQLIFIVFNLLSCQQDANGMVTPLVGPSFVSLTSATTKLYYSNLGVRLDCLADGRPAPVLSWFRLNTTDEQSSIPVESSLWIDVYHNGSLFIRPFLDYLKSLHSGSYACRAENAAGIVQTLPIQLKPQIYENYEIEVKTPYGFEHSSMILSCEISPLSASLYVTVIGWFEKVNDQIVQLDLRSRSKYNLLANRHLIVHNLTRSDDHRSYACLVRNEIDNRTRQSLFKSLRVRERSPFGPELSISNNTKYQAETGDLIELPCGIASMSSDARLTWWKNGVELTDLAAALYNHSLIRRLSLHDAGNYICQVEDDSIGQISSMMSLQVHLPVRCAMNTEQTDVKAGSTVVLNCTTNTVGNTSTVWQWYHNAVLLATQEKRYIISSATRKHMGMYQCCSMDADRCCAQTQIRVINSPPVILSDHRTHSNIVIIPSQMSIDLNCTVYGDPRPEIAVLKDGRRLPSTTWRTQSLPSGDLFLHSPIQVSTIDQAGLYECLATNSLGASSLSKHINIRGQKPFIQPLKNQTVLAGHPFTLVCYASGHPNLHLQWFDETTNQMVNTSTTSPILWTSQESRSKIFTCRAINPYGQSALSLSLTVENPARILSTMSNRTIRMHERLLISCSGQGDSPLTLTIKMPNSKRSQLTETKHETFTNVSMLIERVEMTDSGVYECHAKNHYSSQRSIFEIIVQTVPDRIANLFIENLERIFWTKPFDGHATILQYILHIRFLQGLSWSNETRVMINNSETTSYQLNEIFSPCTISLRIQAVNALGASLPSDAIQFETSLKKLHIAPSDLSVLNTTSNSVNFTWQYPSFSSCVDASLEFLIEILDENNRTSARVHRNPATVFTLNNLNSFTTYTVTVYAKNKLGLGPKSLPLSVQTLESVPLAVVGDLTATLLNTSSVHVGWTIDRHQLQPLNGRFRNFALTFYQNYNMSTVITIETNHTDLIVHNLRPASRYFMTITICNYFDCGPSSSAIVIETLPSMIDSGATTLFHPVNKPVLLECPSSPNHSLSILHPKLTDSNTYHRCGSKLFHLRFYDRPSSVQVKIHYTTAQEIGLKVRYPMEIIESVTINYKVYDRSTMEELTLSPPLFNLRLTNLSCGSTYRIMVYASNPAGFSSTESLIVRTEGSAPSFNESNHLIQTISHDSVILNLNTWIVHQCPILSLEVLILTVNKSSPDHLDRYLLLKSNVQTVHIDQLEPNCDYQLHLKVHSQAGETRKSVSFRTTHTPSHPTANDEADLLLFIIIGSFFLTFLSCLMTIILIKFFRQYLKENHWHLNGKKKFKPMSCSSFADQQHGRYQEASCSGEKNFAMNKYVDRDRSDSFVSEDSQGNINPYAVSDFAVKIKQMNDHRSTWPEKTPSYARRDSADIQLIDRHFCPMILESPLSTHRNPTKRYPLLPRAADRSVLCNPSLNNILPTISSSHSEFPSAFITVPSPKKLSSHDPNSSSADSGVHLCCSSPTEKASPNDSHETATRRMCTASTRSQQSSFV